MSFCVDTDVVVVVTPGHGTGGDITTLKPLVTLSNSSFNETQKNSLEEDGKKQKASDKKEVFSLLN